MGEMTPQQVAQEAWDLATFMYLNVPENGVPEYAAFRAAYYKVDAKVRAAGFLARPVKVVKAEA